jgi:hypothetical protein
MSNQLYYAISGFFTLLIGLPLAFNPIILVVLYYLITKLLFKVLNKTPTELDNIKNNILENSAIKKNIEKIIYYIKLVTDFIFNLINIIYINPLKAMVNYQTKWIEWISEGKATSYVVELVTDSINFIVFQIQEIIVFSFKWVNIETSGIIPELDVGVIDLPEESFLLKDLFDF